MFGLTKKGHFGIFSLVKVIMLNHVLLIGCLLRVIGIDHVLNKCYRLVFCIALLQSHHRMQPLATIYHAGDGNTNKYSRQGQLMHPWVTRLYPRRMIASELGPFGLKLSTEGSCTILKNSLSTSGSPAYYQSQMNISWMGRTGNKVKANVDDDVCLSDSIATCGGLICDENGD
ncbi:hypothetical protein V6N12_045160 [Hibiscus sabdariffa]|uniref:Uncharacterized protein n=1 Tax=Hibiscus sabdariffa TaxID=183260 RepID=A0ABR2G265_9ROSI